VSKPAALIREVVDSLGSSRYSRGEIDFIVRWQIDQLKSVLENAPSFGEQAVNREYAKAIGALAGKLQKKIEGAPEGTHMALLVFTAYPPSHLQTTRPEDLDYGAIERWGGMVAEVLRKLQAGCAEIANNRIGDYHTLDRPKHFCAAQAFDLMIGLEAGEPTNGDPLRFITNSLYEIVAPEEVRQWQRHHKEEEKPDLRAQCEKVLANWRSDPVHLQRHSEQLRQSFAGMIA
jgi:hypothetical protein